VSRAVLVTGAAGGIGRAIAKVLAKEGWIVIGLDLRWAKDDFNLGRQYEVDLADSAALAQILAIMNDKWLFSGLVNCAGITSVGRFLDGDEAGWRRLVEINFLAPLAICKAVVPVMTEHGGGSIVNITSDSARVGAGGEAVYAGTKGGLVAFSKSQAQEVGPSGIRVNCISPGAIETPMSAPNPDVMAKLVRRVPLRRAGLPGDVASAVAFLLNPESAYITGQVLSVSGGLTMAG